MNHFLLKLQHKNEKFEELCRHEWLISLHISASVFKHPEIMLMKHMRRNVVAEPQRDNELIYLRKTLALHPFSAFTSRHLLQALDPGRNTWITDMDRSDPVFRPERTFLQTPFRMRWSRPSSERRAVPTVSVRITDHGLRLTLVSLLIGYLKRRLLLYSPDPDVAEGADNEERLEADSWGRKSVAGIDFLK